MISTDVFSTEAVRPTAVYVCLNDGSANVALALDLEQRLGNSTVVLLPASDAAEPLGTLLQGVGRIRPVLLRDDADAFDLLHDQMREALAHEVHDAYLASRADQPGFGSRYGDLAWEQLPAAARQASRDHVDGIIDHYRRPGTRSSHSTIGTSHRSCCRLPQSRRWRNSSTSAGLQRHGRPATSTGQRATRRKSTTSCWCHGPSFRMTFVRSTARWSGAARRCSQTLVFGLPMTPFARCSPSTTTSDTSGESTALAKTARSPSPGRS